MQRLYPLSLMFAATLLLASPAGDALAQRPGGENRQDQNRGDRDRNRDGDRNRNRDRGGGRGRDNGRDRGDRDGRGRNRGGDRRQMSSEERTKWFISRLDRNSDGKIERSEVDNDRMWRFFERSAKEAGLDPTQTISVKKYTSARNARERQKLREENPTAFLPGPDATMAPGFDIPLSEPELVMLNPDKERPLVLSEPASEEAGSKRRDSPDRPSRESSGDRTERYANSLMDRYDKNDNRILERSEWKDMRGDPERSDLNKDGRITKDELIKRFGRSGRDNKEASDNKREDRSRNGSGKRENAERREPRSRGGDKGRGREKEDAVNETYRFTTAVERLPRDARSWVERYDDNDDGQVAMAEFSSSWTASKVRDFSKYDLDGDGVVTGAEYLESKER